jgi:hypothetical protein
MINKSIENDMLGIAFSEEEFNDKVNSHRHECGDGGTYYMTPTDSARTIWKCSCAYSVITNKYMPSIVPKQMFPVVSNQFNDKLVEDGWHVIDETPLINLDNLKPKQTSSRGFETIQSIIEYPTKDEMILGLIEELIEQGIDEDAHYRCNYWDHLEERPDYIRNFVSDIDKMDSLMQSLRQVVIDKLKKVADSYDRNKNQEA